MFVNFPEVSNDKRFINARSIGTISALDLKTKSSNYLSAISIELMAYFNDLGVLLRPLGSTIYVLPPYCVSTQDLELIYNAIDAAAEKFSTID